MKTHIAAVCCAAALATASFALLASAKTVKECTAEWTANKASIQASGKTRAQFIAECRASDAAPQTAKEAPKTESQTTPATTTPATGTPAATNAVAGKDQYAQEADAKAHCADNPVVWVNLRSKVFHASNSKSYGKTKRGTYMCEKEATAAGYRAPKSRAKKS
jgi:hypothetical protein